MSASTSDGAAPDLVSFLTLAKDAFLKDVKDGKSLSQWVVCTGNEAGDTDSVASAIGFAYFASIAPPAEGKRYVPIVLTPAADFFLRPENVHILNYINVPLKAIVTVSDLPSSNPTILTSLGAKYALVDHNKLLPLYIPSPPPANVDSLVVSIIDHHVDDRAHLSASPRIITTDGSCSSDVLQYFQSLPSFPVAGIPSSVSTLLISAILIDTSLKPVTEDGKATAVDLTAAQYLASFASQTILPVIGDGHTKDPLKVFGDRLKSYKEDVAHFPGRDLIRRDYKTDKVGNWSYGIASVPVSLQDAWLNKRNGWGVLEDDMKAWVEEENLSLLVIGTSFSFKEGKKNGDEKRAKKHARELVLYLRKSERDTLRGVFDGMEADTVLRLKTWEAENVNANKNDAPPKGGKKWRVWEQGNDNASRKQIAPALKQVLENLA